MFELVCRNIFRNPRKLTAVRGKKKKCYFRHKNIINALYATIILYEVYGKWKKKEKKTTNNSGRRTNVYIIISF